MPADQRQQLSRPREVKYSEAELASILDDIPNKVRDRRRHFTPQEDQLILAAWPTKTKEGIARKLGCAVNTLRDRYRELTGGK